MASACSGTDVDACALTAAWLALGFDHRLIRRRSGQAVAVTEIGDVRGEPGRRVRQRPGVGDGVVSASQFGVHRTQPVGHGGEHRMRDQPGLGQLLAVIESPELDQELERTAVHLEEARANLTLARSTLRRIASLIQTHAVSEQEFDDQTALDRALSEKLPDSTVPTIDDRSMRTVTR